MKIEDGRADQVLSAKRSGAGLRVIASGGVTNLDDVTQLAAVPMAGCIIGRALYEKTLTLAGAIEAANATGVA